jgi:DNA-binding PadR family transcriptional regulator
VSRSYNRSIEPGGSPTPISVFTRVAMQIFRHAQFAITMEIYSQMPSAAIRVDDPAGGAGTVFHLVRQLHASGAVEDTGSSCQGPCGCVRRRGVRPSILDMYPRRIYRSPVAHARSNGPLTPAVLHILLALSTGERHGYGIMKQVELDSQGRVNMGPGTLYGSLRRMIDAGLIRESDKRIDPDMDDERRVYYGIAGLGQEALATELERYSELVAVAKRMRLLPNTSAYGL